jgi:hypothetical protein
LATPSLGRPQRRIADALEPAIALAAAIAGGIDTSRSNVRRYRTGRRARASSVDVERVVIRSVAHGRRLDSSG